jgi:hypothetical protein
VDVDLMPLKKIGGKIPAISGNEHISPQRSGLFPVNLFISMILRPFLLFNRKISAYFSSRPLLFQNKRNFSA